MNPNHTEDGYEADSESSESDSEPDSESDDSGPTITQPALNEDVQNARGSEKKRTFDEIPLIENEKELERKIASVEDKKSNLEGINATLEDIDVAVR